ncbi:hypothetical protein ACHHYP_07974 [Achlya hypogyna]|uniref:Uncharacterized protein n=1 Tax=Achlya hypogyna TaxID=1202772 RepID=A0A1V9YQ27_ACHHY|nr:hypothetical protein ACHHYP_07974 [Achlya hypogyna]
MDELLHMRKEIREQVALLHAKMEAILRLQSDKDARFDSLAARLDAVERSRDEHRGGLDKIVHSFAKDVEAKLGALEQRIVTHTNLQTLNEDLLRLQLTDKDAITAEHDHRFSDLSNQIAEEARRVAAVAATQEQLIAKMAAMEALLDSNDKRYESRIAQTLELANALNAGQELLEETSKLETQKTTAKLKKLQQCWADDAAKWHQTTGNQLLQLEVLQREVTGMRETATKATDELKDLSIGLRIQCNSNTSALRALAEELLRLKRHRTEDYRRAAIEELRHPSRASDDDDDVVSVLNKALLQSSYAAFVPPKNIK